MNETELEGKKKKWEWTGSQSERWMRQNWKSILNILDLILKIPSFSFSSPLSSFFLFSFSSPYLLMNLSNPIFWSTAGGVGSF